MPHRSIRHWLLLAPIAIACLSAGGSQAAQIRVDFTADVTSTSGSIGSATVAGTLGSFELDDGGSLLFGSDVDLAGPISVTVSNTTGSFLEGDYVLDVEVGDLGFRFVHSAPITASIADGDFLGSGLIALAQPVEGGSTRIRGQHGCPGFTPDKQKCSVALVADAGIGSIELAHYLPSTGEVSSLSADLTPTYYFTYVPDPPPVEGPEPSAALLAALALVAARLGIQGAGRTRVRA